MILNTYKTISNPSELELRSDIKHHSDCNMLDGPANEHYSKIYGINRCSILDIPHFTMFNGGLACDIMHDVSCTTRNVLDSPTLHSN